MIKSYKNFTNFSERYDEYKSIEELLVAFSNEIDWIKDSLLDLSDSGFIVKINPFNIATNLGLKAGLSIYVYSQTNRLLPIEIGNYLLTIDSYLRENGFVGYDPYDFDNTNSPSRYDVRVDAELRGIKNGFEKELSSFVKMLNRFKINAPFDSVKVSYFNIEDDFIK